jgi:hypothetical protein
MIDRFAGSIWNSLETPDYSSGQGWSGDNIDPGFGNPNYVHGPDIDPGFGTPSVGWQFVPGDPKHGIFDKRIGPDGQVYL